MRLKLNLSVLSKHAEIPVNYQYELSSWIYKTLNFGNPEFSDWLHSEGYLNENKQFKLFTFSRLLIPKYKINGNRLKILSDEISLIVSFLPDKAIETFVTGIFKHQKFGIGDKQSRAVFTIKSVERTPEPEFSNKMKYSCLSPVFIDKIIDGKTHKKHLSPADDSFEELFSNNLISKLLANDRFSELNPGKVRIIINGKGKKNGVLIKAGTPQETHLIAYMFDFELQAPVELQRIGYYAGFGRLNSQGFGCCKIIQNDPG
ncbi:MAG: CRISPR-associated endoribonuclease Cas6 [Chlorobi bacterium]|nr:CRISPR-associated endoribonuclease Cas6 [Chlorobiota bacterium]